MKKIQDIDIHEIKKEHDLIFLPSPNQRATKAKFWKRMDFNMDVIENVTLASAIQLTNNSALSNWWKREGFKEWFLNKDEATERLEYLYMLWMDKVEELLLNPDANHNAIVNIGKVIATLSGRDNQERFSDESIQKMSPTQVRAFIEKLAPRFLPKVAEPIDAIVMEDKDEPGKKE